MGKYALLIGVGEYGEGLQPLPAAPNDVAALERVLRHPEMGGFDDVKTLVNPARTAMEREIELWFQERAASDLVLLFFSGHGVKDNRRELYFAANNTEKRQNRLVRSSAMGARFMHDCVRGCKAKQQVIILDCCFGAAFGDMVARDDGSVDLKEQLGAEGRVVLTSTSAVDYAFEEKGSDLSIYTRYLVEGIETGAADEDGDGQISVRELHRYAGSKVKKAAPAMSPKMITLKEEGYGIFVARSPQDDPLLKYRKEVEKRARTGSFTIPARRLLNRRRVELGVADSDAKAIEAAVLQPYRDYQRKLDEYRETIEECLEVGSPLDPDTLTDLADLRAHLQLKPADALAIERELLSCGLEDYAAADERRRQAELEAQQQATEATSRQHQPEESLNLSSERFGEGYYAKLRDLLAAKEWKAADKETTDRMLQVMDRQDEGWLTAENFKTFPCQDLRNIDRLWVHYSDGKFGFSVQKAIWEKCGSPTEYSDDWKEFARTVVWLQGGVWLSYDQIDFSGQAPSGHLPIRYLPEQYPFGLGADEFGAARGLFSRAKTCGL